MQKGIPIRRQTYELLTRPPEANFTLVCDNKGPCFARILSDCALSNVREAFLTVRGCTDRRDRVHFNGVDVPVHDRHADIRRDQDLLW